MNAQVANLINAVVLIAMGAWGYFGSLTPSKSALIPVFFGIILLVMNNGIKHHNKVIAHIAVVLTLLVFVALAMKPFPAAIERGDNLAIFRVGLMMLTSVIAMVYFIKSFIDARKSKA